MILSFRVASGSPAELMALRPYCESWTRRGDAYVIEITQEKLTEAHDTDRETDRMSGIVLEPVDRE